MTAIKYVTILKDEIHSTVFATVDKNSTVCIAAIAGKSARMVQLKQGAKNSER